MHNEFLKLMSSPLMNLDHTKRYSGTKLVEEETLSQHIIDTIMMGIKVIDKVNEIAGTTLINPSTYVMKAVYHDLEECITGDIPRPLKYYNEATLSSMRSVADDVARELFTKEFSSYAEHYTLWDEAKLGNEGFILKVVDTLVVAGKVVKEVSLLNNNYMLRVAHEVSQYLKEIHDYHYFSIFEVDEYIDSLIEGAVEAMTKILKDNEDIMGDLNICQQSMV